MDPNDQPNPLVALRAEIEEKLDDIRDFMDDLASRSYDDDNDLEWYTRTITALAEVEDKINSRL